MNDQIVPRETIRARARIAFLAGRSRNDHGMNPGSAALVDWLAEFDRLDSERARDSDLELRRAMRVAKGTPRLHRTLAGVLRFDQCQEAT